MEKMVVLIAELRLKQKSWKNKGYTVKAVPIRTEKRICRGNWNAMYNNGEK